MIELLVAPVAIVAVYAIAELVREYVNGERHGAIRLWTCATGIVYIGWLVLMLMAAVREYESLVAEIMPAGA